MEQEGFEGVKNTPIYMSRCSLKFLDVMLDNGSCPSIVNKLLRFYSRYSIFNVFTVHPSLPMATKVNPLKLSTRDELNVFFPCLRLVNFLPNFDKCAALTISLKQFCFVTQVINLLLSCSVTTHSNVTVPPSVIFTMSGARMSVLAMVFSPEMSAWSARAGTMSLA